ncbi:hypothetical protein Btru_004442 [Bulinus truncatus]|nr:hypothetical protein Btru_004442 [Bulinus truncatus]
MDIVLIKKKVTYGISFFPIFPMGVQRGGSDDPYEQFKEDSFHIHQNLITDEHGRVFKKDSRTWLHKSSAKKAAKMTSSPAIRQPTPGVKLSWRQFFRNNQEMKVTSEVSAEGLFRTRSTTEMVRAQHGINKMKKKKRVVGNYMDPSFSPTLDYRSVKEIPGKGNYVNPIGASYPNITVSRRGSCEVSSYASDYCIVRKPSSPIRTFPTSTSGSENDDDEEEEEDSADGLPGRIRPVYEKRAITTDYPTCCVSDGGCTALACRTTSLELSKDGLQELVKVEQYRRRSVHMCRRHDSGQANPPLDVSPETDSSDSRLMLDATYSLSEEYVSGKIPCQAPNSTELLLVVQDDSAHVRSSDLATPTDQRRSAREF